MRLLLFACMLLIGACAYAQTDEYSTSNCVGCHGQTAMGGLGPPIAKTKLTLEDFRRVVRNGKGMMPGTPASEFSDTEVETVYKEMQGKRFESSHIPIAFRVAQLLTTRNVAIIFLWVSAFAFVFALKSIWYWISCSGILRMSKSIVRFGVPKSAYVVLKSLVLDGFLVQSLWRSNRHRWFMHGLMLYGFCGLMLADILLTIFNPLRGDLPMLHPLKLLPVISGICVFLGVAYVMVRYKRDAFIDNGITLGRDFLFVSLLFHTIVSGFLTVVINRMGVTEWVMTVYIYHLLSVLLLIITAPFTRFQHAWIVPMMVAITRLTDEIARSGVDLGFVREPSPGRHHKSERIAASVLAQIEDERQRSFRIRYYP